MNRTIYDLARRVQATGQGWRALQIDRDEENGRFARAVQLACTLADKVIEACENQWEAYNGHGGPYNPEPGLAGKLVRVTRAVTFIGTYEDVCKQVERSLPEGTTEHTGLRITVHTIVMEETE